MKKLELMRRAIAADAHHEKAWVVSIFSVTKRPEGQLDQAWSIRYLPTRTEVLVDINGVLEWDVIEDAEPMKPAFDWSELVTLEPGYHPCIRKKELTTWGTLIFNLWAIWYPFGERYPYVNPDYAANPRAYIEIGKLAKHVAQIMLDDLPVGQPLPPEGIFVSQYKIFGRSLTRLTGFNFIFVPAATPKSMTAHPEAKKILEKRLVEHADRLHDPAVIAEIQNEQVALDQEHLKDDPSMGFFLPGKVWHTARKRMFYIHGPESGLDEAATPELIVNSLRDGWDITKFGTMINSLRAGSYYRGAMTALGGESVKFFLRVFQNVHISERDCGSTLGLKYTVDDELTNGLVGRYQILADNKIEVLDEPTLKSLKGKTILVRSAWSCKTAASDICEVCAGDRNSETPYALGSLEAGLGSIFMLVMMSAAHAKVLSVAELEEDFLT